MKKALAAGEVFAFFVDGDPVGYYSTTRRGQWVDPRAKKYHGWSDRVRWLAKLAGLDVPLVACPGAELFVVTRSFFRSSASSFPDPENVHKGIVDALFWASKAERKLSFRPSVGDRYVGGSYLWPLRTPGSAGVHVTLWRRKPGVSVMPALVGASGPAELLDHFADRVVKLKEVP